MFDCLSGMLEMERFDVPFVGINCTEMEVLNPMAAAIVED